MPKYPMTAAEMKTAIESILEKRGRANIPEYVFKDFSIEDVKLGKNAVLRFSYRPSKADLNGYGGVHGGSTCYIFDTCCGFTATMLSGRDVTTTDLSVSFLRAMMAPEYEISVECTHLGSRMISMIGHCRDADTKELTATCMANFLALESDDFRLNNKTAKMMKQTVLASHSKDKEKDK